MRFRLLLVLFLAMCSSKVLFAQGYTLTTSCYVTLSVTETVSVPAFVPVGSPINGSFSFSSPDGCGDDLNQIMRFVGTVSGSFGLRGV
jgi:hypothetical protein